MMSLDSLAKRYGQRPSSFLQGLNEFQKLSIDFHAAGEGIRQENLEWVKAKARRRSG